MTKPNLRLTLRTLLAYLDDTLDQEQGSEIARKITESGIALRLVERIRRVMRRQRHGSPPEPEGTPVDPNDAAEYLDNVLADDRVADLERWLLESDANLAEIASLHQLLSMIGSKPARIRPLQRERIIRLVPSDPSSATEVVVVSNTVTLPTPPADEAGAPLRAVARILETEPSRAATAPSADSVHAAGGATSAAPVRQKHRRSARRRPVPIAEPAPPTISNDEPPPVPLVLPPYLVSSSSTRWRVISLVAGVVVVVLVTLWLIAQMSNSRREPTSRDQADQSGVIGASADTGPSAEPQDSPAGEVRTSAETGPSVPANSNPGALPVEEKPAPPQPVVDPANNAPAARQPKSAGAPVSQAARPVDDTSKNWAVDIPLGIANAQEGILLRRSKDSRVRRLKDGDFVFAHDLLINLDGFRSTLAISGKAVLELIDGASLTLDHLAGTDVAFELFEGRVRIRATEHARTMRIRFRDNSVALRIVVPETEFALDWRAEPVEPSTVPNRDGTEPAVYVIRGAVKILDKSAQRDVTGGYRLLLARDLGEPEPKPLPEWTVRARPGLDAQPDELAQFARAIPFGDGIESALRRLSSHPVAGLRLNAINGLSAVEDYAGLIDVLDGSHQPDARAAVVAALQRMVATDAEQAKSVARVLIKRFEEEAGIILSLLMDEAASSPADLGARPRRTTPQQLVDLLDSDVPAVRELAIFHLRPLAGSTFDYQADAPSQRRAQAVAQWKRWVANIDNKMPPNDPPQ
jgi:hypothetical protein